MEDFIFSYDEAVKIIRKLAKKDYWQSLYNKAKELGFKLFNNDKDFTKIQLEFLSFLSFYSSIYLDISIGEIDNSVFEDEIYEDAYMYYKMKGEKEEKEKEMLENMPNHIREKKYTQWVFKTPKKKVTL